MILKEDYVSIKKVIKLIKYHDHNWIICVDLKMVNFLLGQQRGFTKHPCHLCLWDSRDRAQHWIKQDWPPRPQLEEGGPNLIEEPLVDRSVIVSPPLHIKLGLMKQFVKALDKDQECFQHIRRTLPSLSYEKTKAGIFDGPQIRKLMSDIDFIETMTEVEKAAWTSFVDICTKFLGNYKSPNYNSIVVDLLTNYQRLGCNMSIKMHFLHSHLDAFPTNLGDVSDEQGERFHQDLKEMEERYQGRWDAHMMADYCWSIKRDCPSVEHKRRGRKRSFLP